MGIGVKQVRYGSEVCCEWVASIMRNPLKKGVMRVVTVAKDGVTKSIGRDSRAVLVEVKKPDGFHKIVLKNYAEGYTVKSTKYPNGSWFETTYNGVEPLRTNGEFVMFKNGGATAKIGYGVDGEFNPEKIKEHFMATLKKLGNPNADVDLREIFGEMPKSVVKRFLGDVNYKISKFIERFNKTNRTLRKLAREFEKNNQ